MSYANVVGVSGGGVRKLYPIQLREGVRAALVSAGFPEFKEVEYLSAAPFSFVADHTPAPLVAFRADRPYTSITACYHSESRAFARMSMDRAQKIIFVQGCGVVRPLVICLDSVAKPLSRPVKDATTNVFVPLRVPELADLPAFSPLWEVTSVMEPATAITGKPVKAVNGVFKFPCEQGDVPEECLAMPASCLLDDVCMKRMLTVRFKREVDALAIYKFGIDLKKKCDKVEGLVMNGWIQMWCIPSAIQFAPSTQTSCYASSRMFLS